MDPNSDAQVITPGDNTNPFSRLTGAFFAPVSTFESIARKPDWLVPLILIVALSILSVFMVSSKIDVEASIREQLADRNMTEEQIDQAVEIGVKVQKFTMPIAIVMTPVMLVIIAGILLLAFRVMGGEVGFLQSFGITLYAWLPQALKGLVMSVLIALRDKVTQNEVVTILKSNLGFLADPIEKPIPFAILSSIDVFNFWTIALLGIGFAFATKWPRPKAVTLVGVLYVVIILFKVGMAALQSLGGAA